MLVMQYMRGVPLSQLEEALKGRNVSRARRRRFSGKLARCYGEIVLDRGFFQADSHPGNILVTNRRADLALLDFA